MTTHAQMKAIAKEYGTPVFIVDHEAIRRNYRSFKKHLPRVQAYYAVKANSAPEIVRTLYKIGASFDVASMPEFRLVYENIKHLPAKQQQDFIWDKIIYANPTKPKETLQALDQYKPLVTYDNPAELKKIKQFAPHAGVVLRQVIFRLFWTRPSMKKPTFLCSMTTSLASGMTTLCTALAPFFLASSEARRSNFRPTPLRRWSG